MILTVNPNRMELIRLRRRLLLAQRGHKLLEDKLEQMMQRFLGLLKDIEQAKEDFQRRTQSLIQNLLYCRITNSKDDFQEAIGNIKSRIKINFSTIRILNVQVPEFKIEELSIERHYDFFKTSPQLDLAVAQTKDYIPALLRLAQLLKSSQILSFEIERTRRRVNALEYILIPAIGETIKFITQKLNELERGNLVRLMRVKEIVRSH